MAVHCSHIGREVRKRQAVPTYEYACEECGERFELRRLMTDRDSDTECSKCGTGNPQRVFSVFTTSFSDVACTPSSPT